MWIDVLAIIALKDDPQIREVERGQEALVWYRQTLALDPSSAETYCDMGTALLELGGATDEEVKAIELKVRKQSEREWTKEDRIMHKKRVDKSNLAHSGVGIVGFEAALVYC